MSRPGNDRKLAPVGNRGQFADGSTIIGCGVVVGNLAATDAGVCGGQLNFLLEIFC